MRMKTLVLVVLFAISLFGCLGDKKSGDVSNQDIMTQADPGAESGDAGESSDTQPDTAPPECKIDEDCGYPRLDATFCKGDDLITVEPHCEEGTCVDREELIEHCELGCGTKGGGTACYECSAFIPCNDEDPCTDDVCADSFCQFMPKTSTPLCDGPECVYEQLSDFDCDGSGCTLGDYCNAGACIPGSFGCETDDPCIEASCAYSDIYEQDVCFFALTNPNAMCVQTRKSQHEGGCVISSCEPCNWDTECYHPQHQVCAPGGYCTDGVLSDEIGDGNFCQTDDDCTGSVWGPHCIPDGISGKSLCQECQDSDECPAEYPVCVWGQWGWPDEGIPVRVVQMCEVSPT
ncbi:MAG: hypothetical protein ABII02_03075 [Candidatus Magasanikbacteria bacterium]